MKEILELYPRDPGARSRLEGTIAGSWFDDG